MNPLTTLEASMNEFTKKEKLVAQLILNDPMSVIQNNAEALALLAKSSKSAFIRMCQKMGFAGYSDFRFSISRYLVSAGSKNNTENPMLEILTSYSEYILKIGQSIHQEDVDLLANWIREAHSIKIFGTNRTGLSAKQLRMRVSKLGIDAESITDTVTMSDVSTILQKNDLCIIFSIKAMSHYHSLITEMHSSGCKIVLLTMTAKTPMKKDVDLLLTFPFISRSSVDSFLDDQAIFFVFIEVLLNALARQE